MPYGVIDVQRFAFKENFFEIHQNDQIFLAEQPDYRKE
jgi:hypothetical protein